MEDTAELLTGNKGNPKQIVHIRTVELPDSPQFAHKKTSWALMTMSVMMLYIFIINLLRTLDMFSVTYVWLTWKIVAYCVLGVELAAGAVTILLISTYRTKFSDFKSFTRTWKYSVFGGMLIGTAILMIYAFSLETIYVTNAKVANAYLLKSPYNIQERNAHAFISVLSYFGAILPAYSWAKLYTPEVTRSKQS